MKAGRAIRSLIFVGVAAVSCLAMAGCNTGRKAYLDRLASLEKGQGKGVSPQTIDELQRGIDQYRAEVEKKVSAAQNLGVYYKMIALKYLDGGMYGLALVNLRSAAEIYPENSQLFYYAGICAARMGKAEATDTSKRAEYFAEAEANYRRAVFLEQGFVDALYGLAVLYAVEMGRPAEAEPLLDTVLEREKKNVEAMFLLARIYYGTGRLEQAVAMYNRIVDSKPGEKITAQARANGQQVEDELYGKK